MTEKYKLTERYIERLGVKLFQIQALVAFGTVVAGELGGYIQSEECLSHYGNAWVSGNARVSGNAQVSGDAQVYGDARVFKRNAIFWASVVGAENGTLTVTSGKNGLVVTRGCFTGTKEEFLSASAAKHNEKIQREYRLLIEVAESRIEQHKAPEPTTAD